MTLRSCSKCKLDLPLNCFTPHKNRLDKLHSQCKSCRNLQAKQVRKIDDTNQWAAVIKHRYNASPLWYDEQLKTQNYKCAICQDDKPGCGRKRWAIDHNHDTGKLRALLCFSCNTGIGKFKDNSELLENAARYIRHHSA